MRRLVRTIAARRDAREIWDYIAADDPAAASRLLRLFDEKLKLLLGHPLIGHPLDEVLPGLRCSPVKSYLLFYRDRPDGIELLRILHGARRWETLF
jgi:toxin ParE1/3/4